MEYKTLGIMMHNRCTANCDICSVECSPHCNEELSCDDMEKFIDSCVETSIKTVSMTGGEPFIRYEVLKELISHCKDKGFTPTTVTNGFWATSYEVTYAKLKELQNLGLARLNVSYDHYHAKYVDIDNIRRIVKACNSLNLPYEIAIIKCKGEKIGDIVDSFESDPGVVNFLTAPCEPVGNAKRRLNDDLFERNIKPEHLRCRYNGIIAVYFDGSIYPCCSHYIFGSKLKIGDIRKIGMPEVLYKIRNNGLLYILRNYGFDSFLHMSRAMGMALPDRVSNPCEVCKLLFSESVSEYGNDVKKFISDINVKAVQNG